VDELSRKPLKLISCKLPEKMLEQLHELVRAKQFPSRSEAIRTAIGDLLEQELPEPSTNQEKIRSEVEEY